MTPVEQQHEFLRLARERGGFLAWKSDGGTFQQSWFADAEAALALIAKLSSDSDVWVSMATFDGPDEKRTAANAKTLCSFWLDVDAHEGSRHTDPAEAEEAVYQFVARTGLPRPGLGVGR